MYSEWTQNIYPVVSYFRLPKSNPRFSFSRLTLFPRYTRDSQSRVTLNHCIHSTSLTEKHEQVFGQTSMPVVSRRPARSRYPRLTHKRRASYGYALGLSDWRLVSGFDCVGTPE